MGQAASDEWDTLLTLLPEGWRVQARLKGAIVRARGPLAKPALLLRLLLLHAASDGGLRTTVDDAERGAVFRHRHGPAQAPAFER